MARWLKKMNSWFGHQPEPPDILFQDLDLIRVNNLCLSLILELSQADNIIWIRANEFERWKAISSGALEFEADKTLDQESRLQGLRSMDQTEFILAMKHFEEAQHSAQSAKIGQQELVLYPVSNKKNFIYGYYLLWGVPPAGLEKIKENVGIFLSKIENHLGFCIEHWDVRSECFHDDLTGLYNQKYLSQVVENEIHRAARNKAQFSVLFMDIDLFKQVNDSKGHWVGSKLLVDLGTLLAKSIRRSDYAFRYGGDEFVVVLPDTPTVGASIVAERIREEIEQHQFLIDGQKIKITMSIGIAAYPNHAQSAKDILKIADAAMYEGKAKSRNIVVMAS